MGKIQRNCLIFVAIVILGAGLRIVLRDIPNFAPVAAIALFAGYCFRNRLVAISVPLVVMIASDVVIGAYQWRMMALVYLMLTLPAVCGPALRRYVKFGGKQRIPWQPMAALLSCSLGASLAFFFVTNFGAWIWFDSYPATWSGLSACYAAALPFFRYTLTGDLLFGLLLFGSYAVASQMVSQSVSQAPAALAAENAHAG